MRENKIINILIYLILIISIFAYENHLYKYYNYTQIVIFLLLFLVAILILRDKEYFLEFKFNLKRNRIILLLIFIMIMSTLLSLLFFNTSSLKIIFIVSLYATNILILFLVIPIYLKNNKFVVDNFIKLYLILITPIIIFGIILFFHDGILGYFLEGKRSGSIYFDSNFFALICALPCVIMFRKNNYRKSMSIVIFILSFSGIIVSGSRGTMLSLVVCLVYYIFVKYQNKKILKKIFLMSIVIISAIVFLKNINNIPFLRLDQGSHGRSEMIAYTLTKLEESPLFGFGFDSISVVLKDGNFSNSNTHNSLVDFAFRYGYPALVLYIIIIIKAFIKSALNKDKMHINLLLILLYINMNTILYSFGGVGLPSIALTLCMGIACYEQGEMKNGKNKYYNTSL